MPQVLAISPARRMVRTRRVLHVGCGHPAPHRLHASFRADSDWEEIRVDVDPKVRPNIVCSTVDMSGSVPNGSVDAVWSSHTIEHLHDHEVPRAFAEFRRVINKRGLLLLRCPDLKAVATCLLTQGLERVAYQSPAGPITALDMLYGHRRSISDGNSYMAHHTGFTDERIGRLLLEAGFAEIRTMTEQFDLWAVAFADDADVGDNLARLARSGLDFAAH